MKLREIYGYTGLLYGANLATSFVTFLVTILLTRHIPMAEFGKYGVFQAYFLLFSYAAGLGISQTMVKFVASRRLHLAQLHTVAATALGLIALVCLGAGAVLIALGDRLAGLALVTVPAYQVYEVALSYARGRAKRHREAGTLLLSSLLTSLFIVFLMQRFPDFRGPVYGQMAASYTTAALLISGFLLGRARHFERLRWSAIRKFSRISMPVYAAAALFAAGESLDRFVVRRYLGFSVVGQYVFAMTLLNIVNKPIALLARVLLSHFSAVEAAAPGPETAHADTADIVRLNLFLIPVFALAVVGFLPSALRLFLTRDYGLSFEILAIVSVVVVLKSVELVNSSLLIAKRTPMTNVATQIASLLVYAPAALLLARYAGVLGVAGAVVLRWVVMALVQMLQMRRLRLTAGGWLLGRAVLAYGAALLLFRDAPWLMFAVYIGVGFGLQLWSARDVERVMVMARPARLFGKS